VTTENEEKTRMDYQIIKAADSDFSEALRKTMKAVNEEIAAGWQPLGGVSVSSIGDFGNHLTFFACQAMQKS